MLKSNSGLNLVQVNGCNKHLHLHTFNLQYIPRVLLYLVGLAMVVYSMELTRFYPYFGRKIKANVKQIACTLISKNLALQIVCHVAT